MHPWLRHWMHLLIATLTTIQSKLQGQCNGMDPLDSTGMLWLLCSIVAVSYCGLECFGCYATCMVAVFHCVYVQVCILAAVQYQGVLIIGQLTSNQ